MTKQLKRKKHNALFLRALVKKTIELSPRVKKTRALKINKNILDAKTHRIVVNALFATLIATDLEDELLEKEFFRGYRHIFEGNPLTEIPLQYLLREQFLKRIFSVVDKQKKLLEEI